ncbi:pleckstrin homology domain containing A5, partial [Homo sapiens]
YTLEQALLSASQEIEMHADNPAAIQTVVLQRDDLQNGLLSTCRELSRATAELERAWREYDKLEYDVTVTRNQMQEQLDHLGEVQTESAGIQRAQIQKELWRIQDVMEGLSKHKQQRGTTEIGSHFPVGVVPPRAKSPTPESSTIASYVTLRKTKKMMDLRTERPRSAVEQLCLAESTRPRMTVEEQMERIRRHQQACLREKKKGLNVIGASDQSPLQSPSNLRDNPFRTTQTRRRDDKELDTAIRENDVKPDHETPATEIVQLKETEPQNVDFSKELKKTENISYEMLFEPEPNGVNSVEMMDKERNKDKMPEDVTFSPQDETQTANHKPEEHPEENTKNSVDEQEETVISYESTPEVSRGNQTMAVKSLSPSPESSASPVPSTQPQLTEGSHFMCV